MTPQEQIKCFKDISDGMIMLRRDILRTLARTKAIESMLESSLPKEKRELWHKQLNDQTKVIFHRLLVSFEKQNPAYAALLDDRKTWEVSDYV